MSDLSIHPLPPQVPAAEAVRPAALRARKSADAPAPQSQPQSGAEAGTLEDAVQHLATHASSLQFSVNQDNGRTIVRVVDRETQKLIRQMPSEEAIAISKSIDRMQGFLLKMKA